MKNQNYEQTTRIAAVGRSSIEVRSPRRPSRGRRHSTGRICGRLFPKPSGRRAFQRTDGRLASWCTMSPACTRSRSSSRVLLAAGQPITDVTWDAVDAINRDHAEENDNVTKEAALALLANQ